MITIRKSDERGTAEHGWLHSRHTFSFAGYHDPRFMGFRALRVINDDRVAPGHGFGTHAHRDMEIISYVLDGALEHADSMGNGSVIRPGDVQRMTAGHGVAHSEYNHSKTELVHFLQIWIEPERRNLVPSYEQKAFAIEERRNALRLIASRDGRHGSVLVHQDVDLYTALLEPGASVSFTPGPGRHVWLHVARGSVRFGDQVLGAGDAAAATAGETLVLTGAPHASNGMPAQGHERAEILLFDLA